MEDTLLKQFLGKYVHIDDHYGFLTYFDSKHLLLDELLINRNTVKDIEALFKGMTASEELRFIRNWNEFALRGELHNFISDPWGYVSKHSLYYRKLTYDIHLDTKREKDIYGLRYPYINKWLYEHLKNNPGGNLMEGVGIYERDENLLHPELIFDEFMVNSHEKLPDGFLQETVCEEKQAEEKRADERQTVGPELIHVKDNEDLPETLRHRK